MKFHRKGKKSLLLATIFIYAILYAFGAQAQNNAVEFDGKSGSSVEAPNNKSFDKIERELTMEA